MKGVITRKDLLKRPFLVIRHFGILIFLKALLFKDKPFLDLIQKPTEKIPVAVQPYTSTMDVFSYYERRMGEIFLSFAERFRNTREVQKFYKALAKQKLGQYALLQFVKSFAAKRKIHNEKWQPHLAKINQLDAEIKALEEQLRNDIALEDAIQITEDLAFSDLNEAYLDLKDSIHSNRAVAISRLMLSQNHYEALCRKGLRLLRKLTRENNIPSSAGQS